MLSRDAFQLTSNQGGEGGWTCFRRVDEFLSVLSPWRVENSTNYRITLGEVKRGEREGKFIHVARSFILIGGGLNGKLVLARAN